MYGRIILTVSAIIQVFGAYLADFNETHVKNPRWPPHARFHNGQTMSMAACLALATLYYTHRQVPQSSAADSLFTAVIFSSLYWITGLSGILYPGALAVDPEFGEGFPQLWGFSGILAVNWLGWWLETRNLAVSRQKSM